MYSGKIFCIGFQKTGTSSMGRALEALGYRVCGAVGLKENDLEGRIRDIAFSRVPEFDGFQDNPWPILYRELDERYPGSRFILTRRNPDAWIGSVVRHFGTAPRPMLEWIYGVAFPVGNEAVFLERYERHNREVLDYFSGRPGDLLIVDIESGDHWPSVSQFLNASAPETSFPHANKGGLWRTGRRLKRTLLRQYRRLF